MVALKLDIKLPSGVFTRTDLLTAAQKQAEARPSQMRNLVQELLDSGRMVRVGRGRYAEAPDALQQQWEPALSQPASDAAALLARHFPLLDFRIWEITWLNEFLTHLIAQNTVFVCVENDGCGHAFEALAKSSVNQVLFRPGTDDLARYGQNNTLAIMRLVSEAPRRGGGDPRAAIEQVVVDLVAERLMRVIVEEAEILSTFAAIFDTYAVDQVAMFRYARRRNKEPGLRKLLSTAEVDLYA